MPSLGQGTLALLACLGAAACARQQARPDTMSAPQLRAVAAEERQRAEQEEEQLATDSPGRDPLSPGHVPELDLSPDSAPPDPRLDQVVTLEQEARAHEQAATALEHRVDVACKDVTRPQTRTCPLLGPITAVTNVEHGVRIRLGEGTDASEALPLMRCHYAFERAYGWQAGKDCALYMPGVEFRGTGDPHTIDIVGRDEQTAGELRKQVRAGVLGPTV